MNTTALRLVPRRDVPDDTTSILYVRVSTDDQRTSDKTSPEDQERRAQQIPLRRLGTVEDTANVALFLASELGSFVTGLYIPVCGGQVME